MLTKSELTQSKKQVSIFLVEDSLSTYQRLCQIVTESPFFKLSHSTHTLAESLEWFVDNSADVLLVDLGLPDGHGTELIRQVKKQHKETEIMVISRFGDESSVIDAIKAGATGYLLKDNKADNIADSILQLTQGGSPISPAIARYVLDYYQKSVNTGDDGDSEQDDLHNSLTPKEKIVLQYISRGYSNKEIAKSVEVTTHTVASHIKNIYRKLQIHSRTEAASEFYLHQTSSNQQQITAQQLAESLKKAGKSASEVSEMLTISFNTRTKTNIKLLWKVDYKLAEIFEVARHEYQLADKEIAGIMQNIGISYELILDGLLSTNKKDSDG